MYRKLMTIMAGLLVAGLYAPQAALAERITVGGKNFTEQLIMAAMTTELLEEHGYDVRKRDGMGSTVLREAQVNGQVDVYWEYTGTSLVTFNEESAEGLTPEETFARVSELDAEEGLVWLGPSAANNTYALAVKEGDDATSDIRTLSDLAEAYRDGRDLTMAVNAEFPHRDDGLIGLQETYDFEVPRRQRATMDSGLTYQALNEGEVEIALVFATDGRIAAFDFVVLEDDRNFFPDYALAPVIRQDTLDSNPELEDLLNDVASRLDDSTMQTLNKEVDVEGDSPEEVAHRFLTEEGLI